MYVRHSAWLNAVPDGQKDNPQARRSRYPEGSPYLSPPPVSEYEAHLIGLWREVGSVAQGANGIDTIAWSEIIAWADKFFSESFIEFVKNPHSPRSKPTPIMVTRCTLPDTELQMIHHMSQEYVWESREATEPNRMCPFEVDLQEVDAVQEADAMLEALREMGFIKE